MCRISAREGCEAIDGAPSAIIGGRSLSHVTKNDKLRPKGSPSPNTARKGDENKATAKSVPRDETTAAPTTALVLSVMLGNFARPKKGTWFVFLHLQKDVR